MAAAVAAVIEQSAAQLEIDREDHLKSGIFVDCFGSATAST